MALTKNKLPLFYSKIIDLAALSASFILLAVITDFGGLMKIIVDLLFYVAVMFISLQVCKRIVFENVHVSGRITRVLLGNVTGLVVGAVLVLLLDMLFPSIGESALVVIFSSILAFFILGTLSPMVKSSHHDIIHH